MIRYLIVFSSLFLGIQGISACTDGHADEQSAYDLTCEQVNVGTGKGRRCVNEEVICYSRSESTDLSCFPRKDVP